MRVRIKDPLAILADNAAGGVVIEDGVIAEILQTGDEPRTPCDETFDASECVVLPGLINTHHHFYQTLTRAYGPALDKELFDWLKTLYPVWAGLTPDYLYVATRLALAELLLSGCTTAADHHYVFPAGLENGVDIQVAAAADLGVRVTLTRGSMNLSVEDGGLQLRHKNADPAEAGKAGGLVAVAIGFDDDAAHVLTRCGPPQLAQHPVGLCQRQHRSPRADLKG